MQTREQHIRREKATRNICTAQVLLAVIASMYGVYHGPEGLRQIAARVAQTAAVLARGLSGRGWRIAHADYFDTIVGRSRKPARRDVRSRSAKRPQFTAAGRPAIGISCDETTTPEIVERVWTAFGRADGDGQKVHPEFSTLAQQVADAIPASLRRKSDFMTHPVFHEHRSETEMLRYLRRLSDRDLALDRTMIPLGSCTMKLNGTAEMMPLTWPGFAACIRLRRSTRRAAIRK